MDPRTNAHPQVLLTNIASIAVGFGMFMMMLVSGAANSLMRSFGTATASAVAGAILSQMTTKYGAVSLPTEGGFKTLMTLGAGAAVLAFAVAGFLPRNRPAIEPATKAVAAEQAVTLVE